MAGVTNVARVPAFAGHAGSFANFEEKVLLRHPISATDPEKKAANLPVHMSDVARKVCTTVGEDAIGNIDGAEQILTIPGERFAPHTIDSIFQDMVKVMYF